MANQNSVPSSPVKIREVLPPGSTAGGKQGQLLDTEVTALRRRCGFHARRLTASYLSPFRTDDAEDLEQDLFLFLWERIQLYDPQRGALSTWAEHVLVSHCASLLRYHGAKCRRVVLHPWDRSIPERDSRSIKINFEFRRDLDTALRPLSAHCRSAIEMLALCGPSEASRRVRRSRSWLTGQVATARLLLQKAGINGDYFDRERRV